MNTESQDKSNFLRILRFGKPHWHRLAIATLAMLVSGVVSIWPTIALKMATDALASGSDLSQPVSLKLMPEQLIGYGLPPLPVTIRLTEILVWLPWLLLAVFTVDGVFRFLHHFHSRYFGVLVADRLRRQGHDKLLALPYPQVRSRASGDLISCLINDLNTLQNLLADVLTTLVKDSAMALVMLGWLLLINWKLTLLGVIALPAFFALVSKLFKRLRKLADRSQEVTGTLSTFVSETVQGMDLLHLFNLSQQRREKFRGLSEGFLKIWRRQLRVDASISPLLGVVSALGIGFVGVWLGLRQVLAGEMSLGDFSSFIVATVLLYQPVKRLFRLNAHVNRIEGTCDRIFRLLDEDTELNHTDSGFRGGKNRQLRVEFRNAELAYEDPGQPAIQGIDLAIEAGEQIALVGPSGSGKSTLVKLIPALQVPTQGRVEVCGFDVRAWDREALRELVAFVPQEPFLFSGSLRDNLLLAKPDATEDEIWHCLEMSRVDFVKNLDTHVGERGSNISGGQRQRVCIARALLKGSPLLILDEPTSSLDRHSEDLIARTLRDIRKHKTVILVSHKLELIKEFPRIIYLEEGRILEDGDHQALMNQGGHYKRLVTV